MHEDHRAGTYQRPAAPAHPSSPEAAQRLLLAGLAAQDAGGGPAEVAAAEVVAAEVAAAELAAAQLPSSAGPVGAGIRGAARRLCRRACTLLLSLLLLYRPAGLPGGHLASGSDPLAPFLFLFSI